jgi:hypothetical protein
MFNRSVSQRAIRRGNIPGGKEAVDVKRTLVSGTIAAVSVVVSVVVAGMLVTGLAANDDHGFGGFRQGTLVLSRSVYVGNAETVSVGQTLPPGCTAGTVAVPLLAGGTASVKVACGAATADGTYPTVFNNDQADGSFGVTAPVFLDNLTTDGRLLGTLAIPSDQIVTSFSSKSELALNRSTDGKSITFAGYRGGPGFPTAPNQLDVSNSNTPGVVDPTNPVSSPGCRSQQIGSSNRPAQGHHFAGRKGRSRS